MNEVETLRERVAELEEQVRYWEGEARCTAEDNHLDRIRRAFDLTRAEAWLVTVLYKARGEIVRRVRLEEDLPGKKDWEERADGNNTICVLVSRIRSKQGEGFIVTARGSGYALSEQAVRRIDGFTS